MASAAHAFVLTPLSVVRLSHSPNTEEGAVGEYELFYETEALQKKITRLTQEYERQVAGLVATAMDEAFNAGRSQGWSAGYADGFDHGSDQ